MQPRELWFLISPFPPLQLPDSIYLVTEEVAPLEEHRSTQDGRSEFSTAWGLHQVLVREEGEERGGGGAGGEGGRGWRVEDGERLRRSVFLTPTPPSSLLSESHQFPVK